MITNLTLANGNCLTTDGTPADAGAVYNDDGIVVLIDCILTNNRSNANSGMARGGALFNNGGTMSLYQTSILNNGVNAGLCQENGNSTTAALGGAIFVNAGQLNIFGCIVSSNECFGQPPYNINFPIATFASSFGGAVYQASGSMVISNSIFTYNLSLGSGGGPYDVPVSGCGGALAAMAGSVIIECSDISHNTAKGGDSTDISNFVGGEAVGGAVYSAAALTVSGSTFYGNQVLAGASYQYFPYSPGVNASGGAIMNDGGDVVLNRCLIWHNYAQGGRCNESFQSVGGGGAGGGIFNSGFISATNCTFAFNSVVGGNGGNGMLGSALGGSIWNQDNFTGMNLTIASNTCSSPTGTPIGTQVANGGGILSLHNSIVANGSISGNAYGTITDEGYNICSDGTANLFSGSSYNYTDPQLGPLGNDGGSTMCMTLLPTSPAIDSGDASDFPSTDQRGFFRPIGEGPDVGAYEFGSSQLVIPYLAIAYETGNVTLAYTASLPVPYCIQASTNLTNWTDLITNGPFASETNVSQTLSQPGINSHFFRLLVQ